MTASTLLWGVLFGSVGTGYFVYGKKQRRLVPLLCDIALIVLPYLVTNTWPLILSGVAIAALPYFVKA